MPRLKRRRLFIHALTAMMLAVYVGSYLVMSRRGFAYADRHNTEGVYFFPPENTDASRRKNYACVYVFYPLTSFDNLIGTGRPAASEPLWDLD